MSKKVGRIQSFLCNRWYEKNQQYQIQSMWYFELNLQGVEICIQKSIQQILEEQNLWPSKELQLEYPKPKCNCYIKKTKCKECVKAKQCKSYKEKKEHSNPKYTSQNKCDACIIKRDICTYIIPILYIQYNKNLVKNCIDCDEVPKKYESISK